MTKRHRWFLGAAAVFVPSILYLDRDSLLVQLVLCLATAAFLALFARASRIEPRAILFAVLVATVGEIVLSVVWGLYSYRHALIPLYVPPGHGLFYALAATTAAQEAIRARAVVITRAVLAGGSLIALLSLAAFGDTWGFLWWIAALVLLVRSRDPLLLSVCFIFTTLLEWTGTAMGNWAWSPEVPGLGLHSANPPSGVGILYIVLDLIVVGLLRRRDAANAAVAA